MANLSHTSVQVDGARQLRASLKAAGISLDDLKEAHRQAGQVVQNRARTTSPVSTENKPHIRDTIRVGATKTAAIIRAGGKRLPYGPVVHWGWFARGIKPHPWVSQAAQDTEPQWQDLYMVALEHIIDTIEGT